MKRSGNFIVDTVQGINFSGNIIPLRWFQKIRHKGKQGMVGKPYLLAIVILSDIVYWYRPQEVRDEGSGIIIEYRKKFKSDFLQRSYAQFSELFGCSKREATNAIVRLEELGLIKRHFRTVKDNGLSISNVLFIELFPSKLQEITSLSFCSDEDEFSPEGDLSLSKRGSYHSQKGDLSLLKGRGYHFQKGEGITFKSDTYTETTNTEITNTKNNKERNIYKERKNDHLQANGSVSISELIKNNERVICDDINSENYLYGEGLENNIKKLSFNQQEKNGKLSQNFDNPYLFGGNDKKIIAQHANTGNFNGLGEEFDGNVVKLPSDDKKTLKMPSKPKSRDQFQTDREIKYEKPKEKSTSYEKLVHDFTDDEQLRSTIFDFIKMRKMSKSPMTDRALKILLNKLDTCADSNESKIALLEESILKNWKSVYPKLEVDKSRKKHKTSNPFLDLLREEEEKERLGLINCEAHEVNPGAAE